MNPLLSVTAAW